MMMVTSLIGHACIYEGMPYSSMMLMMMCCRMLRMKVEPTSTTPDVTSLMYPKRMLVKKITTHAHHYRYADISTSHHYTLHVSLLRLLSLCVVVCSLLSMNT